MLRRRRGGLSRETTTRCVLFRHRRLPFTLERYCPTVDLDYTHTHTRERATGFRTNFHGTDIYAVPSMYSFFINYNISVKKIILFRAKFYSTAFVFIFIFTIFYVPEEGQGFIFCTPSETQNRYNKIRINLRLRVIYYNNYTIPHNQSILFLSHLTTVRWQKLIIVFMGFLW